MTKVNEYLKEVDSRNPAFLCASRHRRTFSGHTKKTNIHLFHDCKLFNSKAI